ncbi:hypothetical protein BH11ACT8_BH11ACT8_29840 [soil metagenome]
MSTSTAPDRRTVLRATVTPLASILGSGLLIIVPVLEGVLGRWSVVGALGVVALAWLVGMAVRHGVRVVEPKAADGSLDATSRRLEEVADAVIVVAYVISVALYLRIMAQYVVQYTAGGDHGGLERVIACAVVVLIVAIGVTRGFSGLDKLDRLSLTVVLALTAVLAVTLAVNGGSDLVAGDLRLPPTPDVGLVHTLLVLGGIVITVQGFETVRYLGDDYDAPTRVTASRVAQLTAGFIYVGFVVVSTPFMGLGTSDGADATLIDITERVAPLLVLPLVISAVLSQFSAATADTASADGNLRGLSSWMKGPRPFLVSGVAAVALAATVPTYTIVAVASRAFAAYYALICVVAFRTSTGWHRKAFYGLLALVMVAIAALAEPAG